MLFALTVPYVFEQDAALTKEENDMATMNDFYPSKYLSASDLKGKKITVTIDHVQGEDFDDHGRVVKKPVVYFKKADKGLVCNKTNFAAIVLITGKPNSDDWTGACITLVPTMVSFNGKMTEAIRVEKPEERGDGVRIAAPVPPSSAPPPAVAIDLDDEIPF
ncbi:MAG: hypothetical protein AAAB35_29765 [Phyllobacterium sp.]|uniref:hypothetical protein n=1 Tax=Phyllobacterium sp. TaxID=1871046 RepID=UPI0030F28CAC